MNARAQTMMFGLSEVDEETRKRFSTKEQLAFLKLALKEGGFFPQASTAKLLGISRQRVHELIQDGKLRVVEALGVRWICGNDLTAFIIDRKERGLDKR